jgi:hypothetical protein
MKLVLVSHPVNECEIRHCVETYTGFARDAFGWLFITEERNVMRMEDIVCGAGPVVAMGEKLEEIPNGYPRQMAAKLFAHHFTSDPELVIIDDDTEAIRPWGREVLFNDFRARMFYRDGTNYYWHYGQRAVFNEDCPRNFQLLLPFAVRGEILAALEDCGIAERCYDSWRRNHIIISEFAVMGEFAWRRERGWADFQNILHNQTHWSLGRTPCFRDWQAFRRSLRKKIARRKKPLPLSSSS